MAKSRQTYGKKEKEKKRLKKKKEKREKMEERKAAKLEGDAPTEMIAYVDEFGNIVDTPPDPTQKTKISADDIELGVPKREKIELSAVRTGRVDFFNDSKGYGFIKEDDTGESYFVHINGCEEDIFENDRVSFELERGMKGMNAVRVKKV